MSQINEVKQILESIYHKPELTINVETFSSFFGDAGIGSISFAWSTSEGVAFYCDHTNKGFNIKEALNPSLNQGVRKINVDLRDVLKIFFDNYKGKLIWHDAYQIKVMVYNIYMTDYLDYEGMLKGIETMTKSFEDTKVMTYLCTNNTVKNKLSLKEQAIQFFTNDFKDDILQLDSNDLLTQSLAKAKATQYVYDKYKEQVDDDKQRDIYEGLFKDSIRQVMQMELVGMPIDMQTAIKVDRRLKRVSNKYTTFLNAKLAQFNIAEVNINSHEQLSGLLYGDLRLPIIDRTKTDLPSTSVKTLEKLINNCENANQYMIMRCLVKLSQVNTMLSGIVPNILKANKMPDDSYRLFGNFNLCGTLSGRMSSSNPNLHSIPSSSAYAKTIKTCFKASKGHVFAGSDYASLEDVINSLLTKDPNKLKVYQQGYDSHMLKTVCYWPDRFPNLKRGIEGEKYYTVGDEYVHGNDMYRSVNGVNMTYEELYTFDLGDYHSMREIDYIEYDVHQINSLKKDNAEIRRISKVVTFPLTYFGTSKTLQNNCGLSEKESDIIYDNYHSMYKVSDDWVNNEVYNISLVGYATTAFGLRIRTPEVAKIDWSTNQISQAAKKEARTIGNAISGQSYGLLTNRAANEFRQRVLNSQYKTKIQIVALIHDAIYLEFQDDLAIIEWVNNNLMECMQWCELEELKHDEVKLSADLGIFHPNWSNEITIKYQMTQKQIINAVLPYMQ